MKQLTRRGLAILLSLVLIFGILPIPTMAAEGEAASTAELPAEQIAEITGEPDAAEALQPDGALDVPDNRGDSPDAAVNADVAVPDSAVPADVQPARGGTSPSATRRRA